jgi:hypothetical protein
MLRRTLAWYNGNFRDEINGWIYSKSESKKRWIVDFIIIKVSFFISER